MFKRVFACHLTLICLLTGSIAATAAERIELARRLIEVSQGPAITQQMFDALMPQIMGLALNKDPDLSEEKKARIVGVTMEELNAAIPEFTENNAKVYADNLTENELQDAIDFYESPTGKKFQEVLPRLMQESMKHGQVLGQKVGQRVFERLKADGDL